MDYLFSVARRSDTPEILNLYRRIGFATGDGCPGDFTDRDTAENDIDNAALFIVTDKTLRIVAAASVEAGDNGDMLSWECLRPCCLARWGVLPEFRRKGIANLLLRKIVTTCRRRKYDGIRLWVSKSNLAAIRFCERNGFARKGETWRNGLEVYGYEKTLGREGG